MQRGQVGKFEVLDSLTVSVGACQVGWGCRSVLQARPAIGPVQIGDALGCFSTPIEVTLADFAISWKLQ